MNRKGRLAINLAVVAAALLLWQAVASRRHDPLLFPTVGSIFTVSLPSFGTFSSGGHRGFAEAFAVIESNALVTIERIALGLVIGVPSGTAFGLLMFYLRGTGGTSTLTLITIRSIPLLALIPLFSLWFGSSSVGIIAYIAFGVFMITASDSYEAAANLSPTLVQLAGLLGARGTFLVRTIYLPGIAGPMAASIRNAVGLSWALSPIVIHRNW